MLGVLDMNAMGLGWEAVALLQVPSCCHSAASANCVRPLAFSHGLGACCEDIMVGQVSKII
jgi:hypothetical protein